MTEKYFKVKAGIITPNVTFSSRTVNSNLAVTYTDSNVLSIPGSVSVTNNLFILAVSANGSFGTSGQVLTSNANGTYWSSVATAASIDLVQSNVTSLTTSVNTIKANVDAVQSNVATHTTNINTVQSNVTSLTTSVNTIKANVDAVQSNVASLTTSVNTIAANVNSVSSNVTNITNGTTAFTGVTTTFNKNVVVSGNVTIGTNTSNTLIIVGSIDLGVLT